MKVFQAVCAFLLVLSVTVGIWFVYSTSSVIHIVLVNDPYRSSLNEFTENRLKSLSSQYSNLFYTIAQTPSDLPVILKQLKKKSDFDKQYILGCYSEPCKLSVLTVLGDDNTVPFFYTGRSNGLATKDYLWNFGPIFNQNIQPIFSVFFNELAKTLIINDESVSSYLTSKILRDLFESQNKNEINIINVEQDLKLKSISSLKDNGIFTFVVNTICGERGELVLKHLKIQSINTFNTCLNDKDDVGNGYFSSVVENASSNESEYIVNLAMYFIEKNIEHEFNLSNLVNLEMPINDQVVVMDYKNRHVWHQIGIYNKNQNGIRTLYQSEELIRPSVYHQLRQPSEWELMVSLYWRNHGGSWGTQ